MRGASRCNSAVRKVRTMTEYTVHFQKGVRVGTRSLRMVHVEAMSVDEAIDLAKAQFTRETPDWFRQRYRMTRVDHFEDGRIVIDR